MLVWTDLETTGLDPDTCRVLEVAAIVTDDNLVEVARFHRVVYWLHDEKDDALLHPAVREMHTKNGLLDDVMSLEAQQPFQVDAEFAAFIRLYGVQTVTSPEMTATVVKPQLAGSTISFDRGFMAKWMKTSLAELHYRNVDVSTLNELARRFWPDVYAARPKNEVIAHRGMADIEESIRVCKHYINAFGAKL